ncbi:Filamentous growth regulator 15 [Candida viswanathii]|uniref:Filamentous growth regulator 15 n=1 Tax=Candida viswanathii TaxID=5486 RepID=A0A367YP73_9ASCO|nr:Filamentous growth regulator 15 [Candida viswanathii]
METPPTTTTSNVSFTDSKAEDKPSPIAKEPSPLTSPAKPENSDGNQQIDNPTIDGVSTITPPPPATTISVASSEPEASPKQPGLTKDEEIDILLTWSPSNLVEYSNHLNKIATILDSGNFNTTKYVSSLHAKLTELFDSLVRFFDLDNPLKSQLYLIIDVNFDVLIKLSTNYKVLEISAACIRFLSTVFMNLNYWEVYNLLIKKPVLYHFLTLINFDLNECYTRFINDYSKFTYNKVQQPLVLKSRSRSRVSRRRRNKSSSSGPGGMPELPSPEEELTPEERLQRSQAFFSLNPDTSDHDRYVADIISGANKQKRKFRPDVKLEHHKIIKKPQPVADKPSTKSSNYDPDVVHECQLPSAEEPHKLCLRRFSRKYELIRHQETVHSKKKKLFKCYVCVKQNPGVGPRIFTRHDTLAKHIRVNHKISGKEAKAEVAYSKKHAEVVEEGDITVHVGRRKTKVDFELRAHMEKRKSSGDETNYLETSDLESGEEEVTFNDKSVATEQPAEGTPTA